MSQKQKINVFILAAGLGTRLLPLTNESPKPVIPIGGRPAILYLLEQLRAQEVKRLIINVHYLPEQVVKAATDYCRLHDIELLVSFEPVLRGTGGAISALRPLLQESRFVLVNGDMLMDLNLSSLLDFHERQRTIATLVLHQSPTMQRYGTIGLDDDNFVVRFVARDFGAKREAYCGMFTGVHIIEPELFDFVPDAIPCDINREVYPAALRAGKKISGFRYEGLWLEFGSLTTYREANWHVCDTSLSKFTMPYDSARLVALAINQPVIIGDQTVIEANCSLGPYCVIGSGCRIGSHSIIRHAIIWDGVTVPSHSILDNVVATSTGQVVALDVPE